MIGSRQACAYGWRPGTATCERASRGLALLVQEKLKADPHSGHLFVFRGREGGLVSRQHSSAISWKELTGGHHSRPGVLKLPAECGRHDLSPRLSADWRLPSRECRGT